MRFVSTCMQEEGAITYSAIKSYLDVRLQKKRKTIRQKEIYDALARLLREACDKKRKNRVRWQKRIKSAIILKPYDDKTISKIKWNGYCYTEKIQ